jgi:hypothetical protein
MEKIHTTIGVYNNGDIKTNGVSEEHLETHIQYNLDYRPGRAFFVNGECLNKGYLDDERIAEYTEMFKDPKWIVTKCTAPYI